MPEGKLLLKSNGKYSKWYVADSSSRKYIPKSDLSLAKQLATKRYISLRLKHLYEQRKAADLYLSHYPQNADALTKLLSNPHFYNLLSPTAIHATPSVSDWINSPYEKNMLHPEQLVHKTSSGIYVRSKSEVLIEMLLRENNIPFRYECALHLGEITLYPDFTLLHPITGEIIYWEHFGMMDDPAYCQNACSKLQLYTSHGILPSKHLITTFETRKCPLDSEYVNKLIRLHFCY